MRSGHVQQVQWNTEERSVLGTPQLVNQNFSVRSALFFSARFMFSSTFDIGMYSSRL